MKIRMTVNNKEGSQSRFHLGEKVSWNQGRVEGKIVDILGRASVNRSDHLHVEYTYDIVAAHPKADNATLRWSGIPEGLLTSMEVHHELL